MTQESAQNSAWLTGNACGCSLTWTGPRAVTAPQGLRVQTQGHRLGLLIRHSTGSPPEQATIAKEMSFHRSCLSLKITVLFYRNVQHKSKTLFCNALSVGVLATNMCGPLAMKQFSSVCLESERGGRKGSHLLAKAR